MRTLAAFSLVVCLAALAPAADLASVVSEETFLFVEVTDPTGVWADFEQSGLRDMVRGMPNGELQFRLGLGLIHQLALQQLGIRVGEFFGTYAQRFALVLPQVPGGLETLPCLLFDVTGKKEAMEGLLRNTVERTLRASNPNATFGDDLHQDVAIRMLSVGGQDAAYAFLGDILVAGPQAAVRQVIDRRALRPLSASKTFATVREKLAVKKGLVAYLNLQALLRDFRPQLDANPELARKLDDLGLTTAKWAAWSAAFDGRGVRDRVYLYAGERQVGLLRLLTSLSPGASAAAAVLPDDCPVLAALTFKDGKELWQAMLRYLEEGGQVEHLARLDEGRQQIMLRMGIHFDQDFVGALGGEVFFAANPDTLTEFAAKGKLPGRSDFPYIIGLRVADRPAMQATVHRAIGSQPVVGQGVDRKVEKHRNTEISVLTIPGTEARPAYAFVGDYLLVAKSAALVRRCIDAAAGEKPLSALRQYQVFPKKMPATYNAMAYADVEAILVAVLTAGKGVPEQPPIPNDVAVASQLRRTYAVLAAEPEGILLETYTRPGLAGILAAVFTSQTVQTAPVAAEPAPPKTDF